MFLFDPLFKKYKFSCFRWQVSAVVSGLMDVKLKVVVFSLMLVECLSSSWDSSSTSFSFPAFTAVQELRKYKENEKDTEVLMSALSAMQEKTQHLENSLSAETRIKLDLFSALGDAKRQLEIAQGS